MSPPVRIGEQLNRVLRDLLAADDRLFLLGEDISDPYGGAFGVTRGLSTRYPERVLSTPISENAIVGVAGGLALCRDRVIVEIMFGDFITLCFDQIVNFATKSVSMYGERRPMHMVIRCPVGGNRGYGPTHSQSPQKHFIGVPHLSLFEMSPLHDTAEVFDRMLSSGEPCIFFEDKVLYTRPAYRDGRAGELLRYEPVGDGNWVRAFVDDADPDVVVIAPGGLADRALAAVRSALVEDEMIGQLLVPSRLYPLDVEPVLPLLARAGRIVITEDGVAGGGWASELARVIYESLWGQLRRPVRIVQPPCGVIPAAAHLERDFLIQESTIYRALTGDDDP